MSRRKQARPKSCKAEDQEMENNDVRIKEEDGEVSGLEEDANEQDMKSTNWLLHDPSILGSTSPSSNSESPFGAVDDSGGSLGGNEDGPEGETLRANDLDPNDIPYVIGVTTENPYGCTFCEKAFAFLSHLHKHEQTHSAQMPFKCAHCPRQFRNQKSRERHERLHSADRKYRCKICGVGYSRSDHLRNHMKNHDAIDTGDHSSHKCPMCALSFSSSITLANHLKKHKEEEEEGSPNSMTRSCLDCHQVFTSEREMMQHTCPSTGTEEDLLKQSDGQPSMLELKCPVCSDAFSTMESLCHHLMCHRTVNMDSLPEPAMSSASSSSSSSSSTAKVMTAKETSKLLVDRSSAFASVEEHNKENNDTQPSTSTNPLVCPYCLIEGFESLESLELHLTSVHNVKPTEVYTCNYCNAPYPNLYSLHDHMTVVHRSQHGLDITYPCSMCVQRFHSLDALAKHKGIVHSQHHSTGIDAAFCNRCNMTLSSPRCLEDHMATVHNIIMEKRATSGSGNKHSHKAKKSSGKHSNKNQNHSNKGNSNLNKSNNNNNGNTSSSKNTSSPKKQTMSNSHHSKPQPPEIAESKYSKASTSISSSLSSSSASSSLTTSPALQTSSSSFPEPINSFALPFGLVTDSTKASDALIRTSLMAKKAAGLSTGLDTGFESSGMTCDHCNATFYDLQNYTAHLLHHTGPSTFNTQSTTSSSSTVAGVTGTRDKFSGFQQQHASRSSSPRDSTSQNGRRTISRNGSSSADDTRNALAANECFKCQATFPSQDQLEAHLLLHYLRVSTEYGCSSCSKSFSKPDELQRHLMDIHAHHLYRCSLCKEIFDSKVNIQVHFAIKHSDECKLYRCAACEVDFHSEMEWQVHVRVNHLHISRPYRCLFCQESFTSEVELQCHLTTHSKPFVCPMCSQAFHIEYLLDQHMQQNHGDVKPDLSQATLEPCSPTALSLLIPTTIKTEHEAGRESATPPGNASPAILSPHFAARATTTPSQQNRNSSNSNNTTTTNSTTTNNNKNTTSDTPPSASSSRSTKTILKSPTASTLGKLSNSQTHGRSSNASSRNTRSISEAPLVAAAIPKVWKNSEHLHMCNICDVKFSDFSLLMMHKAQDHDLKNTGKVIDKSRDEEYNGDQNNSESGTARSDNKLLLAAISNASKPAAVDITPHTEHRAEVGRISGQATASSHSQVTMTAPPNATPPSCMFCSQTFKNNAEYEKHMKIHVNSGNLTCSICDETFSSPSVLAEHKLMHCKIQQGNTCVVCRVTLCNKEQFYTHTQEHGFEGTQLQCVVCRQSLSSLVELQMHGRHHFQTQGSSFTCCVCLKSFESRENLVSKLNTSGRTYYVCKPCYHGEAPPLHTCSQCSEKFATAELLEVHMLTHKSSYQCIKCQQSFSCEYEIQLHVATHLMNEGTQHECRLCGTSCDTPARLQTHLIQHSFSGMDITCFVCQKSFESPQEIQVHVLEHSSSYKKYSCRKCPQRFFFTAELENHKLTYNHCSDSNSSPSHTPSSSSPGRSSTPTSLSSSSISLSSTSNFQASALLASLSAAPLNPGTESRLSPDFQFSKLFSSPQFEKSSNSGKDASKSLLKHRLSLTSSSAPSAPKLMKLDKTKKKGGTLTIPQPPSSATFASPRRLECTDCHKYFTTGTALANHRKTHVRKEAKNSVKCSLCDEAFPSATSMQQHFFSTHSASSKREEEEKEAEKKPTFECMMCEKACATLSALQNHILSHRTQSIGSCSKLNPKKMKDNRRECGEAEYDAMEIQGAVAADDDSVTVNKNEIEEDDIVTSDEACLLACPVCNQVFLKAEDIDDHIKTHQELYIFQGNDDINGDVTNKPEDEKMEVGAGESYDHKNVEQKEETEG